MTGNQRTSAPIVPLFPHSMGIYLAMSHKMENSGAGERPYFKQTSAYWLTVQCCRLLHDLLNSRRPTMCSASQVWGGSFIYKQNQVGTEFWYVSSLKPICTPALLHCFEKKEREKGRESEVWRVSKQKLLAGHQC